MSSFDGSPEPFLSMRDAVMEIRADVKDLADSLARIDREGSMGTKEELKDHDVRLRSLENNGLRLSGAWAATGILAAVLGGLSGIVMGALAYFG